MEWDDGTLRRLYTERLSGLSVESRSGCPSFSAIVRSFSPGTTRRNKKKLIDHISSCPLCYEEFIFLVHLHTREHELERAAADWATHKRSLSSSRKKPFSLVFEYCSSIIIIILVFGAFHFIASDLFQPLLRSVQINTIGTYSPMGKIGFKGPLRFVWRGLTAPATYSLEIFDDELRLIWRADDISSPSFLLSSDIVSRLVTNRKYYWLVSGNSANKHIRHSHLQAFSLFNSDNSE